MLKKAQVTMLPTSQKPVKGTLLFRNAFGDKSLWQYKETHTYGNGTEVYRTLGGSFEDWSVGMRPHHLYFTSDDVLEENDWVIDKYNQIWQYLKGNLIGHDMHGIKRFSTDNVEGHECKKIITSTDKILKLPEPSEQFVQKYVEEYKKGNIISDVLIEYESNGFLGISRKEWIKIDHKDNTITIKKAKDSWTKEERSLDLMNCVSELAAQFGHASTSSEMKKWNDATTNWIKEN